MKISVCMATYNGERFVREQLESILSQLPQSDDEKGGAEVVVADDGSTDRTLNIIQEIADPRVKVLPQVGHLGPVYNFERALVASHGDVIFLADQDDLWLPGKVSKMIEALGFDGATFSANAPLLAVHDAVVINDEGSVMGESMWVARPYKSGVFANWLKNSFTGCCVAFRKELLSLALPFPKNLPMHDQWLGILAERKSGVVAVPEKLISYRVHKNNATNLFAGDNKKVASSCQRIRWRVNLLKAILQRQG
ncbi:MAG: glycosyltransferase family 2 protein [Fibrobacter sp.]|nr:glycosyltransferase family 2 protein [Fibrobacter sp.]